MPAQPSDALPASIRRSAARHREEVACPNVTLCEAVHNADAIRRNAAAGQQPALALPGDGNHAEPIIEP